MDWNQAKDMIVVGIAGGAIYYARQLVESIQELNIKVAIVIEKVNSHEHRIEQTEGRIKDLEDFR